MIVAENISFRAGPKTLLDDVSFRAMPGQLIAITGANGAGKSTLLKLLAKELSPSMGSVTIHNKPLSDYPYQELARFRAVLSQQNTLSVSFRVDELVMMGRYPHFGRFPSEADHDIVRLAMEKTGIASFAGRAYHTLSGGEQQRVQLARVLAQIYDQPNGILLMDEPTTGLDLLYQQHMLQMARELADKQYTVICILHDMNIAARFADRILVLKNGRTIAWGLPGEVIREDLLYQAFGVRVHLIRNEAYPYPLVIPDLSSVKR